MKQRRQGEAKGASDENGLLLLLLLLPTNHMGPSSCAKLGRGSVISMPAGDWGWGAMWFRPGIQARHMGRWAGAAAASVQAPTAHVLPALPDLPQ